MQNQHWKFPTIEIEPDTPKQIVESFEMTSNGYKRNLLKIVTTPENMKQTTDLISNELHSDGLVSLCYFKFNKYFYKQYDKYVKGEIQYPPRIEQHHWHKSGVFFIDFDKKDFTESRTKTFNKIKKVLSKFKGFKVQVYQSCSGGFHVYFHVRPTKIKEQFLEILELLHQEFEKVELKPDRAVNKLIQKVFTEETYIPFKSSQSKLLINEVSTSVIMTKDYYKVLTGSAVKRKTSQRSAMYIFKKMKVGDVFNATEMGVKCNVNRHTLSYAFNELVAEKAISFKPYAKDKRKRVITALDYDKIDEVISLKLTRKMLWLYHLINDNLRLFRAIMIRFKGDIKTVSNYIIHTLTKKTPKPTIFDYLPSIIPEGNRYSVCIRLLGAVARQQSKDKILQTSWELYQRCSNKATITLREIEAWGNYCLRMESVRFSYN